MLLFWKDEITDPKFNTSTYELTDLDWIVNYSVGTLLLFCFLISTILNPVIWFHHRSADKNKVSTFLFSYLAIADFLTNLVAPLGYCYLLMSPKLFSGPDLKFFEIFSLVSCTVGCFSQCLATLLAVSRTLKIINPFILIKQMFLKCYILSYTIFMVFNNISVPVIKNVKEKQITQENINLDLIFFIFVGLCYWSNILHCMLGIVFSMISVVYVYTVKPVSQNYDRKQKASITILLMNVAYIITTVCMFLKAIFLNDR